jgi:hypothetical protein
MTTTRDASHGGRRADAAQTRRAFAIVAVDEPVPRLALRKTEAAQALGMSVDFFEDHVLHELRIVRRGRLILVPIRELERWLSENQHRTLGGIA